MEKQLASPGRLTLEEYEALVEPDDYVSEISKGWLVREPRPGWLHQTVAGRIYDALRAFVMEHKLGAVYFEVGYRLQATPPIVRGPDVSFIRADRLPAEIPVRGFVPFAPDLAIEVLSPSNSATDMQTKVFELLEAGTGQVWVIDPINRMATVYRSMNDVALIRPPNQLSGGDILPGFSLSLTEILR